ncbi:MAG: hypothetical protein ACKO96_06695, partial [Flammeovirgaceae bacterium]
MVKSSIFLFLALFNCYAFAQVKKHFSVESKAGYQSVKLQLKSKTGNCFIKSTQNTEILTVYSNQDVEEYNHNFSNEIK